MASDTEDLVLSISADTRQIMNAIKRLEKSVGASAGQIEKSFSGIGKGIDKSIDTSVQKRINEITGIGVKATKEWTGALTDQSREMDRMRARFNPIFATVSRYKATVAEIQTAHRLGAISADEMTNAIQRERQAALASISALKQRNAILADRPNVGGSNFNTANIAAQFQDIGVTAAMGMSPIQIALQQGTQLSAVLEQMKGNGQSAGAALLSAFTSILSPISLVTIGVVGLSAAALQMSSTFLKGSKDIKDALTDHQQAVSDLRKAYGLAGDGAEEYGRRSVAALEAAERRARAILRDSIAAQEKQIRGQFSDFGFSGFGLLQRFGLIGDSGFAAVGARFTAFAEPIRKLRQEIQQGQPDYETFQRSLEKIVSTDPGRLQPIADEIAIIIDEAATGREQIDNLSSALNGLEQKDIDAANILAGIYGIAEAAKAANSEVTDLKRMIDAIGNSNAKGDRLGRPSMDQHQAQFREQLNLWRRFGYDNESGIDPNKLKKTSAPKTKIPKRTADDRFFEDIEAIRQRTRALAEEQAMLGMSFEAQAKRKVAFELEQKALKDVREEARKKGDRDWQNAQLSPDQVKAIDEVSEAYARQADALRKAQELMGLQRDIIKGALSDVRSALEDGKITTKEWGDIFLNVLDKIINKIEDDLIDAIFAANNTSGGGSLLGSIFSGIGSLFGGSSSGGGIPWSQDIFRESGGPVKRGQPYIVGEKRPELFVPDQNGTIVPRVPQVPSIAASAKGGGISIAYAPVYNVTGSGPEIAQLRQEMARDQQSFKGRVVEAVADARRRNINI